MGREHESSPDVARSTALARDVAEAIELVRGTRPGERLQDGSGLTERACAATRDSQS
jgi:hypothetical protein